MINIDNLISQLKELFKIQVTFDVPEYEKFHKELTQFIYENRFQNTAEWKIISSNLVYKSSQYMYRSEANEILVQLELLKRKVLSREYKLPWEYIHPQIVKVSKKLFIECNYSESAENAFKEIASRIRKIYTKIRPDEKVPTSDSSLMTTTFSNNTPIIEFCDRSNTTGTNIQLGFMNMLAGAMSALRNPDAHSNDNLITEDDCIRRLMFASMLMCKIDDAIVYSHIIE
jgi:uncharacterized protein (TIGR02391 family)